MNLHGIASPYVAAVNPKVPIYVAQSTGYATGASGARTPLYAPPRLAWGQVQPLTFQDIVHVEGLNIQGTKRAIYLEGHWDGLVRSEKKGGDLLTLEDGSVWLVAVVLEQWPDWCKVAVVLQDNS